MVLVVKSLPASAGDIRDVGSIPKVGRSPGEGNGNPLQYPCLENHMDRGAWRATVHGVTKSWTRMGTEHSPPSGLALVPAVAKAAARSSKATLQDFFPCSVQDQALITSLLPVSSPTSHHPPGAIFIKVLIRTAAMSCKCSCRR